MGNGIRASILFSLFLVLASTNGSAQGTVDTVLILKGHTAIIHIASWSPDETKVATASSDSTAKIWNAHSGAVLHTLPHPCWVYHVAWSPDGSRIVTAGADSWARIWDANDGSLIRAFKTSGTVTIRSLWSPDGNRVLTTGFDSTRMWDANNARQIHVFAPVEYRAAAWSPDGARVAISSPFTIWIHDVNSGQMLDTVRLKTRAIYIAWSPDARRIATGGTTRIWEIASDSVYTLEGQLNIVNAIAWSPDGSKLASAGNEAKAWVWDTGSRNQLQTFSGHSNAINSIAWSLDGSRVATAADDSTARIWDVSTGVALQVLTGHTDKLRSVAWSRDGRRVLTASQDNTARIWNAAPKPAPVETEPLQTVAHSSKPGITIRPNPLADDAVIEFDIDKGGKVRLTLNNILGEEVMTLVDETREAGHHLLQFHTRDLAAGIYYIRLESPGTSRIQRLEILK